MNLPSLSAIRASLAKDSLPEFIHQAWSYVEPSTDLKWNWHLDALCAALHDVYLGKIKRLIINVPPGTSKSITVSVLFNAWEWANDPSLRYLTFSYSDKNTIRDNRRLRNIIQSDWFRSSFDVHLSSDQFAKVRFDTTVGGWRIASSVGGAGTGDHPDRIIIDDPIKAKDSRSMTILTDCINWYTSTIPTRIARNPAIIVVMQRHHIEDLSGFLMRQGGWETICFPMHYAPKRIGSTDDRPIPDARDLRTEAGELLWPEMFDDAVVKEEEIGLGEFDASGQLEQMPIPIGGGMFKRSFFKLVDAVPAHIKLLLGRGWDTAATPDGGDYTAGIKMGIDKDDNIYIMDGLIEQIDSDDVDRAMLHCAQVDGRACRVVEEQEPGASGKSVIRARSKLLKGFNYEGVPVSGDKVVRAGPFRAQCRAGNVYMVRGNWNSKYLDHLTSFPFGKYDDAVDGSSCAYNALIDSPKVQTRMTFGKRRK